MYIHICLPRQEHLAGPSRRRGEAPGDRVVLREHLNNDNYSNSRISNYDSNTSNYTSNDSNLILIITGLVMIIVIYIYIYIYIETCICVYISLIIVMNGPPGAAPGQRIVYRHHEHTHVNNKPYFNHNTTLGMPS